MKKVGIMGGTFNPIHIGHLILAKEAYYQYELDTILVIPNKLPAYKDVKELISPLHRENMVRLAIAEHPYMEYSDIELKREGLTYTIDTLTELHALHPDYELYFIMGGDSLASFHKWRQAERILQETSLICARRGEQDVFELDKLRKQYMKQYSYARIGFLDTPDIPISSSELRSRLNQGQDVSEWIPSAEYQYILEHQLYK